MVPTADVRTYYDRPILKEPVWKPEVPWYFFFGGTAGAAVPLSLGARLAGNEELAAAARRVAAAGALVSPVLLITDLGVPSRFLNMLRVFKVTSPMSVGSWILAVFAPAAIGAALLDELGWLPRLARLGEAVAVALGPVMTTYTAALVADTAVPVWHEARIELPVLFAGSAAASAGAAAVVVTPVAAAGPARRLVMLGALTELAAERVMEHRLGELAEPYRQDEAGRFSRAARWLTLVGAATVGVAGRRRAGAVIGGALVLAGAVCQRWAVFRAGFQSAGHPKSLVAHQRQQRKVR